MPQAVIAEDEPLLAAELREELAKAWPQLEIAAVVHDGHAALDAVAEHKPDVCFLDVRMPGLDGLEVARILGAQAHIVFLTAYDQYAVQAFDEGAVDYLLKPLDRTRLARAVMRVKQRLGQRPADMGGLVARIRETQTSDAAAGDMAPSAAPADTGPLKWVTVQIGRELRLIGVDDVCYFQADQKYVSVVTANETALVSTPLKELSERLDPEVFWQIHRGTIVNIQAVRSVVRSVTGKLQLQLKNRSEKLDVSATYAHRFKQL
jgi:DNA-binding LytR/AlgR family response regulator